VRKPRLRLEFDLTVETMMMSFSCPWNESTVLIITFFSKCGRSSGHLLS
jgi:hypothetical protein